MTTRPIPPLGRIVEGGQPMLYTIRELPNGLFLYNRRHENRWSRQPLGWSIHPRRDYDDMGPSLGSKPTLREAAALAATFRA